MKSNQYGIALAMALFGGVSLFAPPPGRTADALPRSGPQPRRRDHAR